MKKLIRSEKCRPLIVIAVLALVVALITAIGSPTALHVDLTPRHVVTPSTEALAVLRDVSEPVDLYLIRSEETQSIWLEELIARFDASSDSISYELVDSSSPRMEALSALSGGQELPDGCVLVVSDKRSAVVNSAELFSYEYDQTAYYYLGVFNYTSAEFTAQNALCRAIDYVTRDDMPILYLLEGHGENGWDSTLNALCLRSGIALETLRLEAGEAVPEDAAAVLLCGPTSPVGEEAAQSLLDYLEAGGDLLLMTDYASDFSGLEALAAHYGMARKTGFLLEDDTNYLYNPDYKYSLLPELRESVFTDSLIANGQRVVLPACEAIERSDVRRAGLNAQPLLLTSDHAYMKADTSSITTLDREDEDESGRFILGMAATEGDTHLVWITSTGVLATGGSLSSGGGNEAFIEGILRQMFDFPAQPEAIPGVSILEDSSSVPEVPALIALIALPLLCLAAGLILRRRRAR